MRKSLFSIRNSLLLLFLLFFTSFVKANEPADSLKTWKFGGLANLTFSQVSFSNWAAGGQSSFSLNSMLNLSAVYTKDKIVWENSIDVAYGLLQEKDASAKKTDDKLELNSKLGYMINEKLYYSALLNAKTQFARGYNYPNDSISISDFMAPAYLTLALGIDYKPNKFLSIFVSPLTTKLTYVGDTIYSIRYGLDQGNNLRTELGAYAKIILEVPLMENVSLKTNLDLFSNYLQNPQNIDVNWELFITMKINNYLSASLNTHLIYDDDIVFVPENENPGPRLQFKEVFGVSLNFEF